MFKILLIVGITLLVVWKKEPLKRWWDENIMVDLKDWFKKLKDWK